MIGESKITNLVLRMMGETARHNVDNYINSVCSRNFIIIKSNDQIRKIFNDCIDNFVASLSYDEMMDLRSYTGYNFRNINAILRGNWTYDTNGMLTEEKRVGYSKLANSVGSIVDKFQMPNIDFMTFRGTTLDSFCSYGIKELNQLESLKGKFLYDSGFTSTSILEESSYFNKKLDDGRFCNVGVRYLIPSESNDGALLIDNEMSYSTNQNEFLINRSSLSRVIDVKINEKNNTAVLTVLLIPKKIYDRDYDNNKTSSRNV